MILVTTFEPAQDVLRSITQNNWDYLGKSPTTQFLHQKRIMMGYRRPKNLRDLLVKADCSLPKNFKVPAQTEARINFLRGTNPPPLAPSQRIKQSSMTDFLIPQNNPQIALHASTSASHVVTTTTDTPTKSASNQRIALPNLLKNKCIAIKACNYCPLLNRSGTITCHVTKKKVPNKVQHNMQKL